MMKFLTCPLLNWISSHRLLSTSHGTQREPDAIFRLASLLRVFLLAGSTLHRLSLQQPFASPTHWLKQGVNA